MPGFMGSLSCSLLLLLLAQSATVNAKLGCQGCMQVADLLERQLYRPEQKAADVEELAGPGRRIPNKLSEGQIYEALEGVCSQYAAGEQESLKGCVSLLDPIKDAVEDFLFKHGINHELRRQLCVELTTSCSVHQLYDSGEL